MYVVLLDYTFIASHAVRMPDGVFEQPHSHEWQIRAAFGSEILDNDGFAIEFARGMEIIRSAVAEIVGKDLNMCGIFSDKIPTTEAVAEYIYRNIKKELQSGTKINYIELTEAPGCTIRYTERPDCNLN